MEDILGKASEVTVIVKNSMSKVSDIIAKPQKIKISSDVPREIICPKLGRTAEGFFHQDIVDERTLQYQLTTSVSYVFSKNHTMEDPVVVYRILLTTNLLLLE